jgi:hypothetical protein
MNITLTSGKKENLTGIYCSKLDLSILNLLKPYEPGGLRMKRSKIAGE